MRDLTETEARELTDRIKGDVAGVLDLIAAAFDGRADVALGYPSWAHYCWAEFPAVRYESKAQRTAAIVKLGERMSGRAVGHALGISETEARRQLREARAGSAPFGALPPTGNTRYGIDGRRVGNQGGDRCPPVPVRATISNALVHYSRQAAALVADLDAQRYPPGFLTPAEVAAVDQFRQAVRDFAQTTEREHTARMAREDEP